MTDRSLLVAALRAFGRDRPMSLAAALSYYTLLSLAPLVLVSIAIGGLVFGRDAVQGRIVGEMRGLVGDAGADVIEIVVANAAGPKAGSISLVIGLVTLFVGATTVFVELQHAVNQIWRVEAKPGRKNAIVGFVLDRLLSLAMVLGVGFLLLVSLIVSAALSALGSWAESSGLQAFPMLLQAGNAVLSFVVIALLFALIFKFLPDVELSWRDVVFGALLTAGLFTVGKTLIGLYLGRASIGSAYGAAGSVVVFVVWVYYAALILLFGVELTRTRVERVRGGVAPKEHARTKERLALDT